jgi:hypothetical protein
MERFAGQITEGTARAAVIGSEVFTDKRLRGRVLLRNKKAWAAKLKKCAVLVGVNKLKKSCHGAHYSAQANREKLGMSEMEENRCRPVSRRLFVGARGERRAGTGW